MDPWSSPSTVAGFATGTPNQALMEFARNEMARTGGGLVLDIGCGAGRNAVPLAALGWRVLGVDLSLPMLVAAAERARREQVETRLALVRAPMEWLPVSGTSCDLVVAHGIWNLARSGAEFRDGLREAARVAKPGAALFIFTFSRGTFDADAKPVVGESFVFTQFSDSPQCFLRREQLIGELGATGFTPDPAVPLRELNRRTPGMLAASGAPVIWEGVFRRVGADGEASGPSRPFVRPLLGGG
jgi:SAM-dependent methyltransferase